MNPQFPTILVTCKTYEPARIAAECEVEMRKEVAAISLFLAAPMEGTDPNVALAKLQAHPEVVEAAWNTLAQPQILAYEPATPPNSAVSDHYFARAGIYAAWKHSKGDPNIVTVIIDTGLAWGWNPNWPPVEYQWHTYLNIPDATLIPPPYFSEAAYHGSMVMDSFVSGGRAAPNCAIGFVACGDGSVGGPSELELIEGVIKTADWATTETGRKFIASISWGGYGAGATAWLNALNYAYVRGVQVFAAAGNSGLADVYGYPALSPVAKTVAACDAYNVRQGNYGDKNDIIGSWRSPDGNYGTSGTAPHMMSCMALVWSVAPSLPAEVVSGFLCSDFSFDRTGISGVDFPNAGYVDVYKAVLKAQAYADQVGRPLFPYIKVRSLDRPDTGFWDLTKVRNGVARTVIEGNVEFTVGGYQVYWDNLIGWAIYPDASVTVVVSIGGTVIYNGIAGKFTVDASTLPVGPVTVNVTTPDGAVTETYDDIVVEAGALRTAGGHSYHVQVLSRRADGSQPTMTFIDERAGYGFKLRLSDGRVVHVRAANPSADQPMRVRTSLGVKSPK